MATLESNTFNDDDIRDRFQIFVEHFHSYLPIVSLPLKITALHKSSPLLFWTIVVISSRFRPLPKSQQSALETEYEFDYTDDFAYNPSSTSTMHMADTSVVSIQRSVFSVSPRRPGRLWLP